MKLTSLRTVMFLISAASALAQLPSAPPPTIPPPRVTPADGTVPTTPVIDVVPIDMILAPSSTGETTIRLDVGFGIRPVLPSRVTVPRGEVLHIVAPLMDEGISYHWTKNGRAISGQSTNVLSLPSVAAGDAATYACLFSTPTTLPQTSQLLVLGVGRPDRLLNLSTRGFVGAGGDQALVSGFVVAAHPEGKKLILRAVGPSLAAFGVANPLARPVLQVFDGLGQRYQKSFVYPGGSDSPGTYEADLAESLSRTGAFTVPAGTPDVVAMMPFGPGSYTVHVTSGDGTSGTVLLEIYEVP